MVRNNHTCEIRDAPDSFTLKPNTPNAPLFRSYGRGLHSGLPYEWRRSNDPPPFRPYGRWLHLYSSLPYEGGRPNEPPSRLLPPKVSPRCTVPCYLQTPLPFSSPMPCCSHLLEGPSLFLIPLPSLWVAQFPSPIQHAQSPLPSYDSHNFPPSLESATDSESDSPPFPESDTDTVASPFPSKSVYHPKSKGGVPCMVPVPPNFGGEPCYHQGPQLNTQLHGQRSQRISLLPGHQGKSHLVIFLLVCL